MKRQLLEVCSRGGNGSLMSRVEPLSPFERITAYQRINVAANRRTHAAGQFSMPAQANCGIGAHMQIGHLATRQASNRPTVASPFRLTSSAGRPATAQPWARTQPMCVPQVGFDSVPLRRGD